MILIPEISKINNRKLKSEIFLGVRLHTECPQHIATLINRLFCSGGAPRHARESPLPLLAWDAPAPASPVEGWGVGGSLISVAAE